MTVLIPVIGALHKDMHLYLCSESHFISWNIFWMKLHLWQISVAFRYEHLTGVGVLSTSSEVKTGECIFSSAVRLWQLTKRREVRTDMSSGVSKFVPQIYHQPPWSMLSSAKSLWLLYIIFSPSYIGSYRSMQQHCAKCKVSTLNFFTSTSEQSLKTPFSRI